MCDIERIPMLDSHGIEILRKALDFPAVNKWTLVFINREDEPVLQKRVMVGGVSLVFSYNAYIEHVMLFVGEPGGFSSTESPTVISGEIYDLGEDFPDLKNWDYESLLAWIRDMFIRYIRQVDKETL